MSGAVVPREPHPLADLFPVLEGEALDALANDIRHHGLRVPITLFEEKILDGRNRYAACLRAGVEPRFEPWRGEGSPLAWVVSVNLHRRHLSESQRAIVGARAKALFEAEAKGRQIAGGRSKVPASLPEAGEARAHAAKLVNVSPRSIEDGSCVIGKGAPELVRAVETGEMAVSQAAKIVRESARDMPGPEQPDRQAVRIEQLESQIEALNADRERRAARQLDKERRKADAIERARRVTVPREEDIIFLEADSFDASTHARLPDAAFDLILTDPPYATRQAGKVSKIDGEVQDFDLEFDVEDGVAYVERLAGLFRALVPKLRPDANAVIFFDRLRLGALADALAPLGLRTRGTFYWVKPNPVPHARGGLWSGVEAALWCSRGKGGIDPAYEGPKVNYLQVSAPGGKERLHHATQKPIALFERLIQLLSPKGGAILDPFAGVGTTAAAARASGRRATSIEINPDYVALARGRLA